MHLQVSRSPGSAVDAVGFGSGRRRLIGWVVALAGLLVVSIIASLMLGAVRVPAGDVVRILAHHVAGTPLDDSAAGEFGRNDAIIWTIRAPRVVLSVVVGAGLAIAGVVLQAMVRNMLADPYVLGVSSGASCGAAASILFGLGAAFGDYALQTSAFLGALVATMVVLAVARSAGKLTSIRLLMAGVAVGYALSALTSFLVFASDSAESSRSVMFWLLGSLGLAAWSGPLGLAVGVVTLLFIVFLVLSPQMDALASGDETALALGIRPDRMRLILLVMVCLLVGTLVAMAGAIGFIGLIVPHLARRIVGGRHRAVLPVAAFIGAILLCWADIASRTVLAPQEIPIGILTALVGAPFLLILVRKMRVTA